MIDLLTRLNHLAHHDSKTLGSNDIRFAFVSKPGVWQSKLAKQVDLVQGQIQIPPVHLWALLLQRCEHVAHKVTQEFDI